MAKTIDNTSERPERVTGWESLSLGAIPGHSLNSVAEKGRRMTLMAKHLRDKVIAPQPRKTAPIFSAGQLADLCGISRQRVNYLVRKSDGSLPLGVLDKGSRQFTLEELYVWIDQVKKPPKRQDTSNAAIFLVANLKGGSTKTTTAMCLAQGLALKGRKVLLVDLDPQGSLTELCGVYADIEISEEATIAPFLTSFSSEKPMDSLGYAVRKTYWEGIDLIPASSALFGAEFNFPEILRMRPDFPIWEIIRTGLVPLTKKGVINREGSEPYAHSYDFIILDTSPSLSYVTVNAIMAADSILMPLVPDSLDFISSVQFWDLFSDLTDMITNATSRSSVTRQKITARQNYDLIRILLTKVDPSSTAAPFVRQWAQAAYGDWLLGLEIPLSAAASTGAVSFNTVYDQMKGVTTVDTRTVNRLRQPFDLLAETIDSFYIQKWARELGSDLQIEQNSEAT